MEKVIVTGALQLSGFHLSNRLLDEGVTVIGIDTLEYDKKNKEEMFLSIGRNANFELLNSVNDVENLRDIDLFFHLCEEFTDERELKEIINRCDTNKVKLIYHSSLEVYGRSDVSCSEDSPLQPITSLGKKKKKEEAIILADAENNKRKLTIFRTPSIYGPWQRQDDCMSKLILEHVKKNISLEKITMKESFATKHMYVDDLIDAMMLAVKQDFQCEIFNLSVNEKKFSAEKAKEWLAFQPKYTLLEGMEKQKQQILKILNVYPSFYNGEQ